MQAKSSPIGMLLLTAAIGLALTACSTTPAEHSETESDAPPPASSESGSVPCSFLGTGEVAAAAGWDPPGSWVEVDVDPAACDWVNEYAEYTLTVQVMPGGQGVLAGITERTEDVMVGGTATRAVRDEAGLLSSLYIIAGADYVVKVTQEPALLEDEPFADLSYTAALAFENSVLNVG